MNEIEPNGKFYSINFFQLASGPVQLPLHVFPGIKFSPKCEIFHPIIIINHVDGDTNDETFRRKTQRIC